VAGEEPAQPGDRIGVEVVGRLVEQQRAAAGLGRVPEQDPGQLDSPALPAGEGTQRLRQYPVGQAQVAQIRAAAASAAYLPSPANWSSRVP